MHTLLDLRGNIPSFIHISDGKLARRSCPRYALAGSRSPLRRRIVQLRRLCPCAFMCCTKPGPSSSRVPSRHIDAHRVHSAPTDRSDRHHSATSHLAWTAWATPVRITPRLLRRIRFKDRTESGKTLVFITNNFSLPLTATISRSPLAGGTLLQVDQAAWIKQFYGTSENAVKTQIWIAVSVYVRVAIVRKRLDLDASLYTLLHDHLSVTLFEKMPIHQALAGDENQMLQPFANNQPIEFIPFQLTGH